MTTGHLFKLLDRSTEASIDLTDNPTKEKSVEVVRLTQLVQDEIKSLKEKP